MNTLNGTKVENSISLAAKRILPSGVICDISYTINKSDIVAIFNLAVSHTTTEIVNILTDQMTFKNTINADCFRMKLHNQMVYMERRLRRSSAP